MNTKAVPLFPLQTVLFPGGPLPLRVFEPRYLDMISRCLKGGEPFGVLLVAEGPEVSGKAAIMRTQAVGTLASICDWYQGTDGLLGITALGEQRFRLGSMTRQDDGLNIGEIEILEPEAQTPLPKEYALMTDLLRGVIEDLGRLYETVEKHYDDTSWVGFRFAEILPLDLQRKQYCLEMEDPLARLEFLRPFLRAIREE
ncbi:MAG: LON peptidase substrate-binding domain-containing protein, partial [Gammaproteobacteria bacterium]|nr:LON peptidase substrate-binding domain-containing protein [Gammaproteobacteria bacterium]